MRTLNCRVLPLVLSLCAAITCTDAKLSAQVRTKKAPPEKQSFPDTLAAAKAAFEAGDFGQALELAQKAAEIARAHLRKKVFAIMPEIPGLEKEKVTETNANAIARLGLAAAAIPLEQKYRSKDRKKSARITVHLGGPVIQTMRSMLQLAKMNPKIEEIKYEKHSGLLQASSRKDQWDLTIFLGESKHGAQIRMNGFSDDEVLQVINQKWVDLLAKTVGVK